MTPCLCDVHIDFLRKRGYRDLKHWCETPGNIYIGRAGIVFCKDQYGNKERYPKQSSILANEFKVGKDGILLEVLSKYYDRLNGKVSNDPQLIEYIKSLKGYNIGCWCVSDNWSSDIPPIEQFTCHGHILLWLINYYDNI